MTLKYFSMFTDYSNQPNLIISSLLSQRYLLLEKKKVPVQVPIEDFSLHSVAMSLKSPLIQNSRSAVFVFHPLTFLKIQASYFGKCSSIWVCLLFSYGEVKVMQKYHRSNVISSLVPHTKMHMRSPVP